MSVGLVLLAYDAAFNIFAHKLCKTRPPEFRGDKLAGLEITRMSGSVMVMAVGKDRALEGIFWGNIDMTFVGQDMIVKLPV